MFFSRKIAKVVFVDTVLSLDGIHRTYSVAGQIFFVSVDEVIEAFDFQEELERITINLTHAHIWDRAAVAAIDKVVIKFRRNGAEVELVGLNEASSTLLNRLAIHDKPDAIENLASH